MTDAVKTVQVRIEGRVQRVGYRAWTEWNAIELALDGWVRNRRDGSVEAVFSGPIDSVEEMLARAQTGPLDAQVTSIDTIQKIGAVPTGFNILPTE